MDTYEGMLAETVMYQGHHGDLILSYSARPLGPGPFPGVVIIHHAPGWDEWSKEVARKLAHHGYAAVLPNLYWRAGHGDFDDVAAMIRSMGGIPDEQVLGDVEGSVAYLKAQTHHSGKVGVMGFCMGGRFTFLAASLLKGLDAAVDCWGGGVGEDPPQVDPAHPLVALDYAKDLSCPLLGIFGEDDARPSPADVARTEAALNEHGKIHEFHSYPGAAHGFFAAYRAGYRPVQAVDGWQKVFAWFEKYLKTPARKHIEI